jgi:hypothetical protein
VNSLWYFVDLHDCFNKFYWPYLLPDFMPVPPAELAAGGSAAHPERKRSADA